MSDKLKLEGKGFQALQTMHRDKRAKIAALMEEKDQIEKAMEPMLAKASIENKLKVAGITQKEVEAYLKASK